MFEKEADFAETKMLINCNGDYSKKKDYKKGWQDGAEFGYNKAKEWHYVKDGDLPLMMEDEREISNNVWIHIKNWGTEVGHYDYHKKAWIVRCMIVNLDVIAWCEIPEYSEE